MSKSVHTFRLSTCFALMALGISACGGGSGGNTPTTISTQDPTSLQVDASSRSAVAYYKIENDTLASLDSVSDPKQSADWALGFKRLEVFVNGGDAGAGDMQVALAQAQDEFYSNGEPNASVFLNATAANEGQTAWDKVTTESVSGLTFAAPANKAQIGSTWYSYNTTTHAFSAKANTGYIIQSGSGDSWAKMQITDVTAARTGVTNVTLSLALQAKGESVFATATTQSYDLSTNKCIDIDTKTAVACTTDTWDIQFDNFNIWLNSGVKGGGKGALAYGSALDTTSTTYTSATTGSAGPIAYHYKTDTTENTIATKTWWEYNLQGNHKIWPNYRVYVIRTGSSADSYQYYKIQLQGYYKEINGTATSGYPIVKWVKL